MAHVPLLLAHGRLLWLRPHYQFFPIVVAGAAILAGRAWRQAMVGPPAPRLGAILLGLNWVMLATAVVLGSPWLGAVAFWELLAAAAVLIGGLSALRAALPALAFLLLVIPPPFDLDTRLVNGLQSLTSKCSDRVLDYVGVLHVRSGNVVEVADKKYGVDEACSGINSLLSTLAVTLFYIFWTRVYWVRAILLILAAVFWVVVANVIRVVLIVWVDHRWGLDLSKDEYNGYLLYQHTILGFILFGLTLAVLASTDRFLRFLGSAVRWDTDLPDTTQMGPVPTRGPAHLPTVGWATVTPALVGYALLVLFQAQDYRLGPLASSETELVKYYNTFSADDLPAAIGPWQRQPEFAADDRKRDDPFGAHFRTWRYRRNNQLAVLSFDYPFSGWHDLRWCYGGIGWTIGQAEFHTQPLPGGARMDYTRFDMSRAEQRHHLVHRVRPNRAGRGRAAAGGLRRGQMGRPLGIPPGSLAGRVRPPSAPPPLLRRPPGPAANRGIRADGKVRPAAGRRAFPEGGGVDPRQMPGRAARPLTHPLTARSGAPVRFRFPTIRLSLRTKRRLQRWGAWALTAIVYPFRLVASLVRQTARTVVSWWRTRNLRYLLQGLPAAMLFIAIVVVGVVIYFQDRNLLANEYQIQIGRSSSEVETQERSGGDPKPALATMQMCFERLGQMQPSKPEFRFGLSRVLRALQQPGPAYAILRTLAKSDRTGYGPAHLELAKEILAVRPTTPAMLVDAKGHLLWAVNWRVEPTTSEAQALLSELYRLTNRPEEAERNLVAAVERAGERRPDLRMRLAGWYQSQGKKNVAVRRRKRLRPSSAGVWTTPRTTTPPAPD